MLRGGPLMFFPGIDGGCYTCCYWVRCLCLSSNYTFTWGLWDFTAYLQIIKLKKNLNDSRLLCYQNLNSPVFSSPERHVLTGRTPPPGHFHIRLLHKLHCNTSSPPELPNTWTNSQRRKKAHILYCSHISLVQRLSLCCWSSDCCWLNIGHLWVSCPESWCHWALSGASLQQQQQHSWKLQGITNNTC